MSAINNLRSAAAAALLVTLAATACGTASATSEDGIDVTGQVDEPRIYPPTDVPVREVPPRIYPPTDIPVRGVPAADAGR
jgi:hypothetical protein